MIPDEVAAVLPADVDRGAVDAHARLYGAVDGPLGETHLVSSRGRVLVATRASSFEPYRVLECAPSGVRYDTSTFSRVVSLTSLDGRSHAIEVSILDVSSIESFVKVLGASAAPVASPVIASPVSAPPVIASPVSAPPVFASPALPEVRHEVVGLLAVHVERARLVSLFATELERRKEGLRGRVAERKRSAASAPAKAPERAKPTPTHAKKKPHGPKGKNPAPKAVVVRDAFNQVPTLTAAPVPEREPLLSPLHWLALLVGIPALWLLAQLLARAVRH